MSSYTLHTYVRVYKLSMNTYEISNLKKIVLLFYILAQVHFGIVKVRHSSSLNSFQNRPVTKLLHRPVSVLVVTVPEPAVLKHEPPILEPWSCQVQRTSTPEQK